MTLGLPLAQAQAQGANSALVAFTIYLLGVLGLAVVANRLLQKKSFLSEYFLGSRGLGVWAFALTFAATSASGGSFMGFPSKIYTHGWILGLWIGSYTVVPICAMGLLGKRLNQIARISGAITVPDVLRDRFHSPYFGLLAVSLIVFFMVFNLVGQFKAGSEILQTLLRDVDQYNTAVAWVGNLQRDFSLLTDVPPGYLLCLLTFGLAVVIYTTYGGFHAVVWTDVMQGVVMVFGVMLMLPVAIYLVGGLPSAHEKLSQMTPPRVGYARLKLDVPLASEFAMPSPWFTLPAEDGAGEKADDLPRLFRVNRSLALPEDVRAVEDVKFVELTTPDEIERQLKRLRQPRVVAAFNESMQEFKQRQLDWLDARLDEGGSADLRAKVRALQADIDRIGENETAVLTAPGIEVVRPEITMIREYAYGEGKPGVYVTGPGPKPPQLPDSAGESADSSEETVLADGFLPLGMAISFFFMWAISGAGQPHSMVRLMAFKNTTTLRRAIFTVAIYYSMIYFPLVIIFCCARVLLPGMDLESDRIVPQMAVTLTSAIDQAWLAGLLVAAPFAAVMSTVDSFLLMISSALVRDIYQRNINPEVAEKNIKRLSYLVTLLVGTGAMLGALNPPQFLQDIIVYTGSGLAACFLGPMTFALYWPRANTTGCISGMLAGFLAHLSMYIGGIFANGSFFQPYRLFQFSPIIIGLVVSFVTVYIVTKLTPPPPEELVRKYFYKK